MAALFYTNHRMKDVTTLFGQWRGLALEMQKQGNEHARKRQIQHSIESPPDTKQQAVRQSQQQREDEFMSDSYNHNPNARFSIDPDDRQGAGAAASGDAREHIDLSSGGSLDE